MLKEDSHEGGPGLDGNQAQRKVSVRGSVPAVQSFTGSDLSPAKTANEASAAYQTVALLWMSEGGGLTLDGSQLRKSYFVLFPNRSSQSCQSAKRKRSPGLLLSELLYQLGHRLKGCCVCAATV